MTGDRVAFPTPVKRAAEGDFCDIADRTFATSACVAVSKLHDGAVNLKQFGDC